MLDGDTECDSNSDENVVLSTDDEESRGVRRTRSEGWARQTRLAQTRRSFRSVIRTLDLPRVCRRRTTLVKSSAFVPAFAGASPEPPPPSHKNAVVITPHATSLPLTPPNTSSYSTCSFRFHEEPVRLETPRRQQYTESQYQQC